MKKLVKKIKISTTIEILSGLHIGGNKDNVEIGGIDSPVIKLASKGDVPYIPGSSLKGKMRCLLEQTKGATKVGKSQEVNRLFGAIEGRREGIETSPSRLIVRDAMMTEDSKKMLLACDNLDMPYTENKFENTIDRIQGVAQNPRQLERVPAGAIFNAEFVINVWDDDNEEDLLALFKKGVCLLENDYLGGSGSRGYGQIKFGDITPVELSDQNAWGQNA